jgi:hypothetical protein
VASEEAVEAYPGFPEVCQTDLHFFNNREVGFKNGIDQTSWQDNNQQQSSVDDAALSC